MLHKFNRSPTIFHSFKLMMVTIIAISLSLYLTNQFTFTNDNQQGKKKSTSKSDTITIDRELFDYLAFHLRDRPYDGVQNYTRFMTAKLGLKALTGVQPVIPGMGKVINDIDSFQYPINIGPCRPKSGKGVSLFIAVISAASYVERRAIIRQTWTNHLRNQTNINHLLDVVGFGFVIGLTSNEQVQQQVRQESEQYGDILQINVEDKYIQLSVKDASLLKWINQFCAQVDYVFKVDDDVYVNIHNLATVLHSLNSSDPSIYGRRCGENIPQRHGGKWETGFELWPWQRLPLYFHGAGILMTGTAIRPLLAAVQTTPYFVWEDMYLIGICAVKAGLHLYTSNQFFINVPENYEQPCFVRDSVTWTTQSAHVLNVSHSISHGLYHHKPQTAHCVDAKTNITYKEPANKSNFHFDLIP